MSPATDLGVVDQAHRGTPAIEWASWQPQFHEFELGHPARVVVVAPHPDDEVLGCGALASAYAAAGIPVMVIAVTDGAAAYPRMDPEVLGQIRVRESERACADLGLEAPMRCALPDGAVTEHEAELTQILSQQLRPQDLCLATWRGDGHPDHDAVGRAAAAACVHTGAELAEYPVWMWHWARPADERVPWDRAYAWKLDPLALATKTMSVSRFASQLVAPDEQDEPILPGFVIDRLVTPRELIFRAR